MARRQVSIFINGREVGNNIKAIRAEKAKLNKELNLMVRDSDEYNKNMAGIRKANQILSDHRQQLRGVSSTYDKIKAGVGNFVGIAAGAFAADRIVDYGKQLFKLGTEMEVLGRKAETVFAQSLPLVTRAAEENANAMGLTKGQYVDAAAVMGDLLIPMQFSREETARLTTNTVNLSGALAEWTGGQKNAEEVSKILSKALLGEREELKQLGIAINEADVKQRLKEKGVENLTGKLLQQAKATATLELITEKSTDAQAAFIENSNLSIRKQAELNAKFDEIKENIATALIPVFAKLIDNITPIVDAFNDFISIPVEEKLQAEQEELNLLVSRITEANISQEDRNKLINQLQNQYPNFLGNLSAEKVSNQELADRLKEVNDQYIFKIALQKEDNKIQEAAERLAEEQRDLAGKDVELQQKILNLNKEYNLDLDFTNKTLAERLELTKVALKELSDNGTNIGLDLAALEVSGRAVLESRVNNRKEELEVLKRQKDQIKENLAAELGINVNESSPNPDSTNNLDSPIDLQAAAKAEENRKRKEKEREREIKAQEKQYEQLLQVLNKFEEEIELSELDEFTRHEAQIRNKYEKEIALTRELEKRKGDEAIRIRKELEALRDEELEILEEQRTQKAQEQFQAFNEAQIEAIKKAQERKKEVEAELKAAADEVLLDEQNLALLRLEENYLSQLALAEQFGVETNRLTQSYRQQKAEINNKFNLKEKKDRQKAQKEQADLLIKGFETFSSGLTAIIQLAGKEGTKAVGLSKILAVAQIGINSAEAISKATAAAAGVPFPGNLAAIATAVGTVLANIAQASSVLNSVSVPQKRKGSFFKVKGQDDGFTYNAKYLGQQQTGMLPSYPVLVQSVTGSPVLASEAGSEYFVANHDLQNPAIFNYVQAIENIKRTRQFVDGGFTDPNVNVSTTSNTNNTTTAEQSAASNAVMLSLLSAINRLNDNLEGGIRAMYDDEEVANISDRQSTLSAASGGFIN